MKRKQERLETMAAEIAAQSKEAQHDLLSKASIKLEVEAQIKEEKEKLELHSAHTWRNKNKGR